MNLKKAKLKGLCITLDLFTVKNQEDIYGLRSLKSEIARPDGFTVEQLDRISGALDTMESRMATAKAEVATARAWLSPPDEVADADSDGSEGASVEVLSDASI